MVDLADDHYALDISRAQNVLGWQPTHSLRDALPKMVGALKTDREKFYKQNKLGEPPARVEEHEHDLATKESS
jgi:dTDP-D-glucose 4,6-dehydratase